MVDKGKRPEHPTVDGHFTTEKREEFSQKVWDFLVSEIDGEDAVIQVNPKQIKGYAEDFLSATGFGKLYWPLSALGLWKYDFSQRDAQSFVEEIMSSEIERRKHPPEIISDDEDLPNPEFQPKASITTNLSKGKGPSKRATGSQMPRKTVPTPKKSPVNHRYRDRSPTTVPDVPFSPAKDHPPRTPRRSIRPTPESKRIAEEKFTSPTTSKRTTSPEGQDHSTTQALEPSLSPGKSRKRAREEDEHADTASTSESARKKAATVTSPPRDSPPPLEEIFNLKSSPSPVQDSITLMPPPDRRQEKSADTEELRDALTSITALGLPFSADSLAKVPECILGYISECEHHQIRLANETEDGRRKDEYRARSTLLLNLYADVKSRIHCMAEDAKEKGRIESSHCLWN